MNHHGKPDHKKSSSLTRRRWIGQTAVGGLGALALGTPALSQSTYPNRPIKLMVPWPPGQATDLAARVLGQELSKVLGQPIVIDNRAGAGGTIGTDAVAKAAPDGYTLLAASSGPVSISPLFTKTPYETDKDLQPIAMLGLSPYLLLTGNDFPAKDAKEFVALVKANPGKYSFASSGTGATAHLICEAFNAALGLQAVHVPYKGSVPALTDVISGQVSYCIETAGSSLPFVRNGRLRAYGVSLEKGSNVTPGIAPLAVTAGVPGFDLGAWFGMMAPAGTPRAIVDQLSGVLEKVMQSPETRKAFDGIAIEIDFRKNEEFSKYLKMISTSFGDVIRKGNIKP
jgi:tripartite-type tricarboxylate transporter receptor subunit TctC